MIIDKKNKNFMQSYDCVSVSRSDKVGSCTTSQYGNPLIIHAARDINGISNIV